MNFESIVLVASVLVVFGVLIGWKLSRWRFDVRTRRQVAARVSVCKQLHDLQVARKKDYFASSKPGGWANGSQRRAA
jgi:hypothetical protein